VESFITFAEQNLDEADGLLHRGGSKRSILKRATRAASSAAYALLLTVGRDPKGERGTIELFDRDFVLTGKLKENHSKTLHWLFDLHTADDGTMLADITEEEWLTALERAREFVVDASNIMKERGYLD
jgi:uncharacterized protein (UPF0332 family)